MNHCFFKIENNIFDKIYDVLKITKKKLRDHFEEKHGLDYTIEAVTQMITNRGHSLESIKK